MSIPCSIYHKNEVIVLKYLKEYHIFQKTNRVVYEDDINSTERVDGFLTKNLKIVYSKLQSIKPYIKNAQMIMELIVYTDDIPQININKTQAELISKIGCKLNISFH